MAITAPSLASRETRANREVRLEAAFQPRALRYAHITGWGMALPDKIMPNADFEALVHTSDQWIYARTGICQRRIAEPGETTTTLAIRAARQALATADILPAEVDFIIVATSTPEYIFPSTASLVQDAIGAINAGGSDVAAACAGFMYALDLAVGKVRSGSANTVLVIGAETMSRVLDWKDRKTCILFGDGAGAVVLQGSDRPGGMLSSQLGSDGSGWDLLTLPTVNSQSTYLLDGLHQMHTLYMEGRCVFKFAAETIPYGLKTVLDRVGLGMDDLDILIPHQANQRILEAAAKRMNFPAEKIFSNLERYGNTSAASIPIAICEAAQAGRLQPGYLVGLVGFGGGLSWGAAVIEWGVERAARAAPGLCPALQPSARAAPGAVFPRQSAPDVAPLLAALVG